MDNEQQPERQQKKRGEYADKPYPAQVGADKRRLAIFLNMLHKIEIRRRQNHNAGRCVHEDDNRSFQQMRGHNIRTLRITDERKWAPAPFNGRLLQLLVGKRNAVYLDQRNFFLNGFKQFLIYQISNVGDTYIRLRALANLHAARNEAADHAACALQAKYSSSTFRRSRRDCL